MLLHASSNVFNSEDNRVLMVKEIELCFGEGVVKWPRKNHLEANCFLIDIAYNQKHSLGGLDTTLYII